MSIETPAGIGGPGDLVGRVAIVTGGAQGIGRAFVHAYAAAGAACVVADLNERKARAVAAEVEAAGGRAIAVAVDVADADAVGRMADAAMAGFERIDILVNNAAIFSTLTMRPFDEIPLDEWRRVIDVNVTGPMLACRAVVAPMRSRGWGRIITMSSGSVTLGRPNYLHYTTSKAAVIGMTRSLARELGQYGITANAILPGPVFTEIPRATVSPEQKKALVAAQCIQRPETPDDLVGTLLFLSGEGSAFLTGQTITVDGGATHP